jgi:hypothetical protein
LFSDFLVFHAAARAVIEGKLSIVYGTSALTQLQNELYAARLPFELGFRPFLYPPIWLLGLLPFGPLPIGAAIVAFLTFSSGFCVAVLRMLKFPWLAAIAVVASPAAVWVIVTGQNTFLSVALLYGGLMLLGHRPLLAGVLLGLLVYKPQIWVLVPLALLAAREWRPLIAALATTAVLFIATFVVFGGAIWLDFAHAAHQAATDAFAAEMYTRVHTQMTTVLAAAKALGLGDSPAIALQLAGAAFAIGVVIWVFSRYPARHERTAILVTATFLVSPYTLNYDLLLLMPAVALLLLHPPSQGYRFGELPIYLVVWLLPTASLMLNRLGVPLTPLVVLLFGAIAWMRLRGAAKVELPQPATAR